MPDSPSIERTVTINFHPDRFVADGAELLIERLARDPHWRTQFETGTSNGGLTAYPGGDRWRWEHTMFGGRYDDGPPEQRPRYGALNHRDRPVGGAMRFGSAHLRLRAHVLERTTFCYPDSVFQPRSHGLTDPSPLVARADADAADGTTDALDDYVEAHVHGPISLIDDVAAVVLDRCYLDTMVADAAAALPVRVEWHDGFRLPVDELAAHPDYRGPHVVDVARAVARDHTTGGTITPAVVGQASRSGRYDPQDVKKVWHHVARWGWHEPW
jgi:hypothetical protein